MDEETNVERHFFDRRRELDQWQHRLPHWQQQTAFVFVTWRLSDSIPVGKLQQWEDDERTWTRLNPKPWDQRTQQEYHKQFSSRLEQWLDQGSGSCILREPANAEFVCGTLRFWDGERYDLEAFVVMPNHVHVLFQPHAAHSLASIVKSCKGFSARAINTATQTKGPIWQESYWDRLIRDETHFAKCREYIRRNPEKAGLPPGAYALYIRGD